MGSQEQGCPISSGSKSSQHVDCEQDFIPGFDPFTNPELILFPMDCGRSLLSMLLGRKYGCCGWF